MAMPMTGEAVTVYGTIVDVNAKRILFRNGTQPLPLSGVQGDKQFTIPREHALAFSKVSGWVKMQKEVAKLLGLA